MKIAISSRYSANQSHGGSIIAYRQAEALKEKGHQVAFVIPSSSKSEKVWFETYYYYYQQNANYLSDFRPNERSVQDSKLIFGRIKPDILYDLHGLPWPVQAAIESNIPTVSMIGDYAWFCQRVFLVNSALQRCLKLESYENCKKCLFGKLSLKRRAFHFLSDKMNSILPTIQRLIIKNSPDHALLESRQYLDFLRKKIDCFIIGDLQALEFFLSHGIEKDKLFYHQQALPHYALKQRARKGFPQKDERPINVGFIGRLHPDKGFHVLVDSMVSMKWEEIEKFIFYIVHSKYATPQYVESFFKDKAFFRKVFKSGHLVLSRPQSQDELYMIMAQLDLGIIPSIQYEAPNLVLLELVAQKTPIVRSESKGMSHIIQNDLNGKTFPYGDSKALKNILIDISNNPRILSQWQEKLPKIESDEEYIKKVELLFYKLID